MNFTKRFSPNYRNKQSTMGIMVELSIALAVVTLASVAYYQVNFGLEYSKRVVLLVVVSVLTNIIVELIVGHFRGLSAREVFTQEFPWVTGLILALTVSVNTSYYAVALSTAVAVLFAKVVFGGFGQNIFNPAGIGRALVFTGFSGAVVNDITTGATPTATIAGLKWLPTNEGFQNVLVNEYGFSLKNLLLGNHAGEIGETFALLIMVVGIVMMIRQVIDWRIPVVYVGGVFIFALIIGMMNGVGIWYPLYHILTGGVMFGAVFMLTDPVTSPTQNAGKVIYALGAAILTVLIRLKANLPEGVVFSILLMNMLTPLIEDFVDGNQIKMKKKYITSTVVILALGLVMSFWIGNTVEADDGIVPVALGDKIAINDEKIDKYKAEILNKEEKDGNTVFTVSAEGYHIHDDEYAQGGKPNQYMIAVDSSNKIVSAELIEFNDTEGIGDQVNNVTYFDVFTGQDITALDEVDTVSGATKTSYSFISALRAVAKELGA